MRIDVPAAGGALREAALHRLAEKEGGLGVCLAARTLGPDWLAKNSSYSCGGQGTCASLQVRRGGCRVGLAGEFGRGRRVQLPAFRVSPSAGCAPARLRLPCWSFAQLQLEERGFVQSAHLRQCGRWIRGEGIGCGLRIRRTTRTDVLIRLDFAAQAIGNARRLQARQ